MDILLETNHEKKKQHPYTVKVSEMLLFFVVLIFSMFSKVKERVNTIN